MTSLSSNSSSTSQKTSPLCFSKDAGSFVWNFQGTFYIENWPCTQILLLFFKNTSGRIAGVLVLLCWILEKQTLRAEFTLVHTPWNSQITHHTSLDYFQNRISNLTVTVKPPQQTLSAFWYIQELTHPRCCTGRTMQKRFVYWANLKNSHSEKQDLYCRFLFPGELPLSLSFTPCFYFH